MNKGKVRRERKQVEQAARQEAVAENAQRAEEQGRRGIELHYGETMRLTYRVDDEGDATQHVLVGATLEGPDGAIHELPAEDVAALDTAVTVTDEPEVTDRPGAAGGEL